MRCGLPAAFFAPCAIRSSGSRAAAPSATSVPRKPRRGAQQAQLGSPGISTLLFFEAMLTGLPPLKFRRKVSYHGDRTIREDTVRWRGVIRAAGVKPE